jgi:hypothetical protein
VFGELLDKLFADRRIGVEHDTAWELHKADVEPSTPARSEEALRGANYESASPVSENGLHHAFSSSHSSFFGSPYHLPLAEGETFVDTTENTRKASEYETGRVLAHPEGIPKTSEGCTNELKVATKAAVFHNHDGNCKAFSKHLGSISPSSHQSTTDNHTGNRVTDFPHVNARITFRNGGSTGHRNRKNQGGISMDERTGGQGRSHQGRQWAQARSGEGEEGQEVAHVYHNLWRPPKVVLLTIGNFQNSRVAVATSTGMAEVEMLGLGRVASVVGPYPSSDLMVNKLESHGRAQTSNPSNGPFKIPKLLDLQ